MVRRTLLLSVLTSGCYTAVHHHPVEMRGYAAAYVEPAAPPSTVILEPGPPVYYDSYTYYDGYDSPDVYVYVETGWCDWGGHRHFHDGRAHWGHRRHWAADRRSAHGHASGRDYHRHYSSSGGAYIGTSGASRPAPPAPAPTPTIVVPRDPPPSTSWDPPPGPSPISRARGPEPRGFAPDRPRPDPPRAVRPARPEPRVDQGFVPPRREPHASPDPGRPMEHRASPPAAIRAERRPEPARPAASRPAAPSRGRGARMR